MKLHLPLLLLSALVVAQLGATATADTVIASGYSYDVGKATPHYSGTQTGLSEDYLHCWATSASNVIQNWQDKYSGNAENGVAVPNGTVTKPAGSADGTANLQVYRTILENSYGRQLDDEKGVHELGGSDGGTATEAFKWWFTNTPGKDTDVLSSARTGDGSQYYNTLFGAETVSATVNGSGWPADFTEQNLKDIFAAAGGGAVTLEIHQTSTTMPFTDGLGYHSLGDQRSHSITCWGYETDNEGNITAVFLSDSDDMSYGIFKVQATHREGYDSLLDYQTSGVISTKTSLHLDTDDLHNGYNGDFEVVVEKAETIVTPETAALNDGASATPDTMPADGRVTRNTTLTEDITTLNGKGVVVGHTDENTLVMLTSANGKKLILNGDAAAVSGLKVEKGSLASIENVSISDYNGSGMELKGRAYLHDGTVSIKDNRAANGGAANVSTYLEIEGNSKVDISGNSATEKGGAIYNTGIASIFGNTSVEFSGNTASAEGGQDIYNAKGGIVNIYNNDAVVFKSSEKGAAVRNEGELYIAAKEGHDVTFQGSSLDSRGGKTYVGADLSHEAINSTGGLTFTDKSGTKSLQILAASEAVEPRTPVKEQLPLLVMPSFTHYQERTPAVLDNVTISAQEIAGAGAAQSSVKGAQIISDDDLNASHLTIDKSSTLTAAKTIHLDNVVIKLADVTYSQLGNSRFYDLSGTLTASQITMNNLVFDADGLELGTESKVMVYLGTAPLAGTARLLTADGLRDHVELENGAVYFSGDSGLVPEPTTATLSLLALAALAAHRKRRHA